MPKMIYDPQTNLHYRQKAVADLYVANFNLNEAVKTIYPKLKRSSVVVYISRLRQNEDWNNYVAAERAKLIDKSKWNLDQHLDYLREFANEMREIKKYHIAAQLEKTILEYSATTKMDITTNGQSINTIKLIEIKKD